MMGMRTALSVAFLLSAALPSCNRVELPAEPEVMRTVSFVVGVPSTRASVTPYEGDVASLDVLVFRTEDGRIENANRAEAAPGEGSLTGVTCSVREGGSYRWYVVANAPQGTLYYGTEEAFLSGVTLLTHGTATSLVMMDSGTLDNAPSDMAVPVALDRYACKVTVESVTMDWPDAFTLYSSVTLGRVVLVNVVGSTPWSGVPAAGDLWYNRMGVDSGLPEYVADMTVKDWGGMALVEGVAASVASPLYAMPNPTVNDVNSLNAPEWSPRCTRVAVEVLLDGTANWYPVDLPAMRCNTHYVIRSLILKGPGSAGPDRPVERDDVRFTVTVEPWGENKVVTVYD